jgi:hypothetical protein
VQYLSIKWSSLPFLWKGKTRVKRIYQGFVLNEEPVEMALIMPFSCNSRRKVLTNPRRNSSQHGNYKRTSSTPQASLPIDTLIGRFRYIGCRPSIGLECPRGSSIAGCFRRSVLEQSGRWMKATSMLLGARGRRVVPSLTSRWPAMRLSRGRHATLRANVADVAATTIVSQYDRVHA